MTYDPSQQGALSFLCTIFEAKHERRKWANPKYRNLIITHSPLQWEAAKDLLECAREEEDGKLWFDVSDVKDFPPFKLAEERHQNYNLKAATKADSRSL